MNSQEHEHADLPRRITPDALDADIEQSQDRTACVFGSKLETPRPWVIKRTVQTRAKCVAGGFTPPTSTAEYYTGMAETPRNWSVKEPSWNRQIACAVGFADRDEALTFIRTMGLKPRAEVVLREAVNNEGR